MFQEAEEIFLNVTSEKLKTDYAYLSWLGRCFIMNGKVEQEKEQEQEQEQEQMQEQEQEQEQE